MVESHIIIVHAPQYCIYPSMYMRLFFSQLPYTNGFSFDFFGTKEGVLTAISCSFSLVAWTGAAVLGRFRAFLVHLKKTHICTHLCINTLRIRLHIHIYAIVVFVSLFLYISTNMNIRYYIPWFNLLLRTCQSKLSGLTGGCTLTCGVKPCQNQCSRAAFQKSPAEGQQFLYQVSLDFYCWLAVAIQLIETI